MDCWTDTLQVSEKQYGYVLINRLEKFHFVSMRFFFPDSAFNWMIFDLQK